MGSDGNRICIYTVTHKLCHIPSSDPMYQVLLVGKQSQGTPAGWLRDSMGDSISDRNGRYNELTGLYWIWKNAPYDIVGLCHYRRFFATYKGKIRNLVSGEISGLIDEAYILKQLRSYDIILHNKTFFKEGNQKQLCLKKGMRLETDNKIPVEILDLVERIFRQIYPSEFDVYKRVMNGHSAHLLNMMIAEKDVVDRYCQWLFALLFRIEICLDEMYPGRELPRLMGLIAERLLDVWVTGRNLKVKECFTVNTERIDRSWIAR